MAAQDEGSMGSATDGDEDAVTGLIYLAELLCNDDMAPSCEEVRP